MVGMLAFLEEGTWVRDVGVPILLTVVAAIVATVILRVVVGRFKRKLEQAPHLSEAGNLQRAATLAHAQATSDDCTDRVDPAASLEREPLVPPVSASVP
jgi:hypothetical protein